MTTLAEERAVTERLKLLPGSGAVVNCGLCGKSIRKWRLLDHADSEECRSFAAESYARRNDLVRLGDTHEVVSRSGVPLFEAHIGGHTPYGPKLTRFGPRLVVQLARQLAPLRTYDGRAFACDERARIVRESYEAGEYTEEARAALALAELHKLRRNEVVTG